MKKLLPLLLFVTAGAISNAQSTRMVLFEEFTGENCGPCAAVNPAINAVLEQPVNQTRVAAIKWQVPIPSAPGKPTSIYQTNKNEINWRHLGWNGTYSSPNINAPSSVGYGYPSQYTPTDPVTSGVNSAPQGRLDGQYLWSFGAGSNYGGSLSSAAIAAAAAVPSPFTINMARAWNSDGTAVTLTITVTASMNYTATGALIFRTVMVERLIEFSSPSGSNGETKFKDAAIKSFPTLQGGTPLASSWNVNDSHTFTLNCVLPPHVNKKTEVAFVGFIQDDGTRKVQQAAKLDKALLTNDARAASLTVPPACSGTMAAQVVIENSGLTPLTTLTITPYTDGTPGNVTSWTGNLASGSSATLTLDAISSPTAPGPHTFSYSISGISGIDMDSRNNGVSTTFLVATDYQTTPVKEGFTGDVPPPNWTSIDNNSFNTWVKTTSAGGWGLSPESMMMSFYTNPNIGEVEEMILPPVDLTGPNVPVLEFLYAYASRNQNNPDRLEILASKDCGENWSVLFDRSGMLLATKLTTEANMFLPKSNEWAFESLQLTDFNAPNVIVKFRTTNRNGNALYVDDINLGQPSTAAVSEHKKSGFNARIYPNPAGSSAILAVSGAESAGAVLSIVNVLGQTVTERPVQLHAGSNNVPLDLNSLANGIYYVTLQSGDQKVTEKLTITH